MNQTICEWWQQYMEYCQWVKGSTKGDPHLVQHSLESVGKPAGSSYNASANLGNYHCDAKEWSVYRGVD
jgi:hypothetical protein